MHFVHACELLHINIVLTYPAAKLYIRSCEIKAEVVKADETEDCAAGTRATLNFGQFMLCAL